MGSHDPFGYLKHKLWEKEGPKVKLPIWFRPWKVENRPDSLVCRWHVTYCWKALDKGYNFASNLTSIEGLDTKFWDSKIARVLILGISGLQLGSPGTKWHLGAGPTAKHIIYYKGKVVVSSKSGLWWVLWVHVCLWFVRAPKVLQLCINQLVVWFLQVHVSNWVACHSS